MKVFLRVLLFFAIDGIKISAAAQALAKDFGDCPLNAIYYASPEQPPQFEGNLTEFFQTKFASPSFKAFGGPMLLSLMIDSNGYACSWHARSRNLGDPATLIENLIPGMKWTPGKQDGHHVFCQYSLILKLVDSALQVEVADGIRLPNSPVANLNQENKPTVTKLKRKIWKNWTVRNSALPDNRVIALSQDRTGAIWCCTRFGVARIRDDGSKWDIFSRENVREMRSLDSGELFTSLAVDLNNNVWISTLHFVVRYDGHGWTRYDSTNTPLTGVHRICTDSSGVIWICTGQGLIRIEGNSITRINTRNSPLASDEVHSVYEDENKTLWIATAKGLNKIQNGEWTLLNSGNSKLAGDDIRFVTGDRKGTIWASCQLAEQGFLIRINAASNGTVFPSIPINSLAVDPKSKNLWISGLDEGIIIFNGKKVKVHDAVNSPLPSPR